MRQGGTPRNAAVVPSERLDTAVDELLALGRERGEQLRSARSAAPSSVRRDTADIGDRLRLVLKTELSEVGTYSDDELVELAWKTVAALDVDEVVKSMVISDLSAAEKQLRAPALAAQGRGRLRRFIFARIEWLAD